MKSAVHERIKDDLHKEFDRQFDTVEKDIVTLKNEKQKWGSLKDRLETSVVEMAQLQLNSRRNAGSQK